MFGAYAFFESGRHSVEKRSAVMVS